MTEFTCRICGNTFEREMTLLKKDLRYKHEYCSQDCAQASRIIKQSKKHTSIKRTPNSSKEEVDFGEMIKTFFPQLQSQYQLKNYHHCYDFYSPELDLLIEYDGLYWHNKPRQQAKDKKHLLAAKQHQKKLAVITDKDWKMFIDSGMPSKPKLLKLLNYNIKK